MTMNDLIPAEVEDQEVDYKDYYSLLGITKEATDKEIIAAYRNKANVFHPDKEGGDANMFAHIRRAFEVLVDKEKRERYDTYGHFSDEDVSVANNYMMGLINHLVESDVDLGTVDIVTSLKKKITQDIQVTNIELRNVIGKIHRIEKAEKRTTTKLLLQVFTNNRIKLEDRKEKMDTDLNTLRVAKALVETFVYEFEQIAPAVHVQPTGYFSTNFTQGN